MAILLGGARLEISWVSPPPATHEDLLYKRMFGQTKAQVNKKERWVPLTATIEGSVLGHVEVYGPFAWDEDPDPNTPPEDIPDITDDQRARWRRETMRNQPDNDYEPTDGLTIDELLGLIDETLQDPLA